MGYEEEITPMVKGIADLGNFLKGACDMVNPTPTELHSPSLCVCIPRPSPSFYIYLVGEVSL